jgi:HK97 family phage portal protein
MGLIFGRGQPSAQRRSWGITGVNDLIPLRTINRGKVPYITADSAFKNSAVWAAIRLRADMISTMPVKSFRDVTIDGEPMRIDAPLSPFMTSRHFMEWLYSSQVELDRSGNSIGIITDVDGQNYPANIDLYPSSAVTIICRDGKLRYRINGTEYDPDVIWHEKQFTVSGSPIGLSPVANAAMTLGQYATIQDFASDWFSSSGTPRARLKNTAKRLNPKEALVAKEAWRAAQASGDLFVHGNDWEYDLIQTEVASAYWMDAVKFSLEDASRYFGVPADLIDAAMNGPNITYANVVQRNLQFLVLNLDPALRRRENALSDLLPRPRQVTFDEKSLLRMDPLTRAQWALTVVQSRTLAPSELRAMDNKPPYTPEQIKEFDDLGLNRRGSTPLTSLAPLDTNGTPVALLTAQESAPADDQGNTENDPGSNP